VQCEEVSAAFTVATHSTAAEGITASQAYSRPYSTKYQAQQDRLQYLRMGNCVSQGTTHG